MAAIAKFDVTNDWFWLRFDRVLRDLVPVWVHQDFLVDQGAPGWEKETDPLERARNALEKTD